MNTEQARAIAAGMEADRKARIRAKLESYKHQHADDSVLYKEDFVLYPVKHYDVTHTRT